MRLDRLPLPRPAKQKTEPTNIHLPRQLKEKLAQVAVQRYGLSMTGYLRAIAEREVSLKRGVLWAKLK